MCVGGGVGVGVVGVVCCVLCVVRCALCVVCCVFVCVVCVVCVVCGVVCEANYVLDVLRSMLPDTWLPINGMFVLVAVALPA